MFNREVELTLERVQLILSTRERLKGVFDLLDLLNNQQTRVEGV